MCRVKDRMEVYGKEFVVCSDRNQTRAYGKRSSDSRCTSDDVEYYLKRVLF
jgi:hypothetical protein